jgi:hypothetical protein
MGVLYVVTCWYLRRILHCIATKKIQQPKNRKTKTKELLYVWSMCVIGRVLLGEPCGFVGFLGGFFILYMGRIVLPGCTAALRLIMQHTHTDTALDVPTFSTRRLHVLTTPLAAKGGTMWARMVSGNIAENTISYDIGLTALLPLRRKERWGFFSLLKIRRFRPALTPRTWVTKASTPTPQTTETTFFRWVTIASCVLKPGIAVT